ncbi:Lactose operon repressor [compost metagenome]
MRIIGYDDVAAARWVTPELTSIKQPIDEFGQLAVSLLCDQAEGKAIEISNTLPVQLIERSTT